MGDAQSDMAAFNQSLKAAVDTQASKIEKLKSTTSKKEAKEILDSIKNEYVKNYKDLTPMDIRQKMVDASQDTEKMFSDTELKKMLISVLVVDSVIKACIPEDKIASTIGTPEGNQNKKIGEFYDSAASYIMSTKTVDDLGSADGSESNDSTMMWIIGGSVGALLLGGLVYGLTRNKKR